MTTDEYLTKMQELLIARNAAYDADDGCAYLRITKEIEAIKIRAGYSGRSHYGLLQEVTHG